MKCILYVRKSTEENSRQFLSIEAQFAESQEYVVKEKLGIAASSQEVKIVKEHVEKNRLDPCFNLGKDFSN